MAKKAEPKAPAKPRGRPTEFSPELARGICILLADGKGLRQVCADEGMPAESTVRAWAIDDVQGFGAQYARAREIGYLGLGDEILDIADTPVIGSRSVSKPSGLEITEGDMIEHRRLQVDARKWVLSKMLPKVYGDKLETTHKGSVGVTLNTTPSDEAL